MALKLADLLKIKPQATLDTSIGALCLFSISVKGQSDLLQSLDATIEDTDPKEYVKKLIKYVCFPKSQLKDGEFKPDTPILSLEQIKELLDNELEDIAKNYVLINEYLFKKNEIRKKKDANENDVHYSVYTEIEHPQKDGESFINYLHRLSCFEQDKQKARLSNIFDSIPKLNSFSKSLSGGIAKNLLFGDEIVNSFKETKTFQNIEVSRAKSPLELINWNEIERNKEKIRREPFDALAQRLDELIGSSTQASEFMIEANRIQTEIATEIKTGGDTTDRHSRKNIKLTIIVILLTVSGLLVSSWSAISGTSFSKEAQNAMDINASKVVDALAISNSSLDESRNKSLIIQNEILSELKKLNENLSNTQNSMNEIYSEIETLKASNQKEKDDIKQLSRKLSEAKEAIK